MRQLLAGLATLAVGQGCAQGVEITAVELAEPMAGPSSTYSLGPDLGIALGDPPAGDCTADSRPVGVAVVDLDGDDAIDIAVLDAAGAARIYGNHGDGTFSLERTVHGQDPAMGIGAADVDGDGLVDLVLAGASVSLFAGRGDFEYDDAQIVLEPSDGGVIGHVGFGDADNDGRVDMTLAGYMRDTDSLCETPEEHQSEVGADNWVVLRRDGGWDARPLGWGITHLVPIRDFDRDGVSELYEMNEKRLSGSDWPDSYVWRYGEGGDVFPTQGSPMGLVTLGDANGNGCPEVVVGDIGGLRIWELCGGELVGHDLRATASLRAAYRHPGSLVAWSTVALGGGRAFVANARLGHPDGAQYVVQHQPDFLVGWEGDALDLLEVLPGDLPSESGRSAAAADLDGDGVPEVVVRHLDGPVAIWTQPARDDCAPLVVRLEDRRAPGNPQALGAIVEAGTEVQYVTVDSATYGADPADVYLCVEEAEVTVSVRWPDGEGTEHPLAPGRRYLLTRS